jgi:hypothetical protein
MGKTDYYRLEYNEKLGKFNFGPFSKRNENVYGWETISMVITLEELQRFIDLVVKDFPDLKSDEGKLFPELSEVKRRFNEFSGVSDL